MICIALLFFLTAAQVILRYGFGYSSLYTEEAGRYLLIWAALIGMAIETRHNGHIRIGFLAEQLPSRVLFCLNIFLDLAALVLFLTLVYTGIYSTIFNHGQESAGMQLPLSFPFVAIPVFFMVAALFSIERLLRHREPGM